MAYYDEISDGYDELHKEEQLKKLKIIKNDLKINKSDTLLDVGAGSGISSDFDCRVYCLDPSEELLKRITNRKIRKIAGKAENIPFPDDFFDVVISVTAIHNFDDIEKGLLEMKRVGKDRFVFSVLKKSKKFNIIKKLIEKYFRVNKTVEEEKDMIFFCSIA